MDFLHSMPKEDGFRMPGEFEQHLGTLMIWPVRPGSWPHDGAPAKKVFSEIIHHIAKHEKMFILCDHAHLDECRASVGEVAEIIEMETDDAWARDTGPTFVTKGQESRCINWSFNAWGGRVDGLYSSWDKDDRVAKSFADYLGKSCYDAAPFVLEGGSIHSDGEGTVIVTKTCLLSAGRNPLMTQQEITEKLKKYLGAEKVIWLPYGIYNDETNEHVDNVCCFSAPGEILLAVAEDENDPQYHMSRLDLQLLEKETDAKGRHFRIRKLPIPKKPVCVTKEDLSGYVFEEGEDTREEGERLAASYANFYIANGCVLVPQFGDENDSVAVNILKEAFPGREIIPVYARDIIVGGGNIHCITQQIY